MNCENTTEFVSGLWSLVAVRSFKRAKTFEDALDFEEDASSSASEGGGGAENRSEAVRGRRQRGQVDLVCFRVLRIHAWQKM